MKRRKSALKIENEHLHALAAELNIEIDKLRVKLDEALHKIVVAEKSWTEAEKLAEKRRYALDKATTDANQLRKVITWQDEMLKKARETIVGFGRVIALVGEGWAAMELDAESARPWAPDGVDSVNEMRR